MKAEQRTMYIARDGEEFRTEALCRAHERKTSGALLVGLSARQVEAARTGANPQLAEAFLMFANEMRNVKRRRANGAEATANNRGDKAGAPLPEDADNGRAGDSAKRTDSERTEAGNA